MRQQPLPAAALLLLLAGLTTACRRESRPGGGRGGGTIVISVPADADVLIPPLTVNSTSAQVDAQLFEHLAVPGGALNTIGDEGWFKGLANGWRWGADSLSLAFRLDPSARWHDGRPVRSGDVRFTWRLYTDSAVGSATGPLLANIDSVTTPDSLDAVFWFRHRSPEQFYDAAYRMFILPEHLLDSVKRGDLATSAFARAPIGSGPFRFVRWVPRQTIELEANRSYHRGRARLGRVIWSIAPDPRVAVTRVLAGEADMVEFLPPPAVAEIARHPDLKAVRYPSLGVAYLLFNERDPRDSSRPHPIFGSREVRRALTMAVDRASLVRSVFDSLATVAVGPVTRALPTYDSTLAQLPFAPDSARRLLDAAGWRATGPGGLRRKGGRPLRFGIIVPSASAPRMRMAVLMQAMFKAVGAQADIEAMDFPTHLQRLESRRFDASMNAAQLDPTPSSIRQSWSSAAMHARDGTNFGSYANARFDALVDSATARLDSAGANALYRRAYETLVADAPAIWLYEPVMFAGVQRRIRTADLRADAWWAHLDQWYIPPRERIARDRLGGAGR